MIFCLLKFFFSACRALFSQRRGDFVAVEAGLQGNETIASGGAFKLFNGQAVEIGQSGETTYSLSPQPHDG